MKNTKRIYALLLCALFLCSTVLLCACKKEKPDDGNSTNPSDAASGETAAYKVTVVDGLGNPYTEKVIVKFLQNGEQVAMSNVNENGVAEKELPQGEYTVEIAATGSDSQCWYDPANVTLTAEKTELEIVMAYAPSGDSTTLQATSLATNEMKEYEVHYVGTGSSYIELDTADRTYVLFAPTEAGVYEVSTNGGTTTLGYYGGPHFVQANNAGEVVDNVLKFTVSAGMIGEGNTGTTTMVIGIDSEDGTEGTILNIVRTGDPEWSVEDEPWSNYQPTVDITPYALPEGVELKSFNLTVPNGIYTIVYSETDGYYHLYAADGPVVYVQLANAVKGISLMNMVGEIVYEDGVLMQTGTAPFRYMYNNGQDDFFKEDYTDAMRQFVTNRDKASGVYPLTKDLEYILKKGIEFIGWCDKDSSNYLFADEPNINPDLAWMFLCFIGDNGSNGTSSGGVVIGPGYSGEGGNNGGGGVVIGPDYSGDGGNNGGGGVVIGPGDSGDSGNSGGNGNTGSVSNMTHDNKRSPIELGGADALNFSASVQANHVVYYNLYKVSETTLRISNSNAIVIYNGNTYQAVNGVVTVPDLYSKSTNLPVKVGIGNVGSSSATFYVSLSYPQGHYMNPYSLSFGPFTTNISAGNDQGVYYTFTASKSGTLSIRLDSVTSGTKADIVLYNQTTYEQINLTENGGNTVKLSVSKGDQIQVIIQVQPDENYNYPASTIKATTSIT